MPAIFWTATKAWWDDDAIRLGASLAYYTLFALAPILLVATAAGIVFGAEAAWGQIVGQLDQLVGPDGARAVQSLLEGASHRRRDARLRPRRHHIRRGRHRRLPRTPGSTEHNLAREIRNLLKTGFESPGPPSHLLP